MSDKVPARQHPQDDPETTVLTCPCASGTLMPKSVTFMRSAVNSWGLSNGLETRRLSGLMSRCTTPLKKQGTAAGQKTFLSSLTQQVSLTCCSKSNMPGVCMKPSSDGVLQLAADMLLPYTSSPWTAMRHVLCWLTWHGSVPEPSGWPWLQRLQLLLAADSLGSAPSDATACHRHTSP